MDRSRLEAALGTQMPTSLADDLVEAFLTIRQDYSTRTFGRAAPGKFVETVVQILQHRTTGSFDSHPKVEDYLKNRVEQQAGLDDGLRICGARLARATYALRSKRNIAHKQAVDPNSYDLHLIHSAAQWMMAELLRLTNGISMEESGTLIEMVHAPLGPVVEEIDGRRIVHGNFSTPQEILVLLRSHFPDHVLTRDILESLDRRKPSSIRARITELYKAKLVQGDSKKGYRLTSPGFNKATELAAKAANNL